jgi:hypothetical protein
LIASDRGILAARPEQAAGMPPQRGGSRPPLAGIEVVSFYLHTHLSLILCVYD